VDSLFEKRLLREEVQAALRRDPTLDENDRRFALEVALSHREEPWAWNVAAWDVVKVRGSGKGACARALRHAEAAFHLTPENGNILNTLGVAQYRVGRYAEALATRTKSDKLNATKEGSLRADLTFLAMTQASTRQEGRIKVSVRRIAFLTAVV
jgi:hypothetical protein